MGFSHFNSSRYPALPTLRAQRLAHLRWPRPSASWIWPQKKVRGLMRLDELADRPRAGVQSRADLVERRAVAAARGTPAPAAQRSANRSSRVGELLLAVFARRIERRRIGIAEPRHVPAVRLEMALVEIVQPMARAHAGHLVGRFVVARAARRPYRRAFRRISPHRSMPLDQVTWSPAAM